MKSIRFSELVFAILFFFSCYSQDINANPAGNFTANIPTVITNTDKELFKETGKDLSSRNVTSDFNGNRREVSIPMIRASINIKSNVFYVDNTANGTYDGRSWANAWNPTNGWDSSGTNPNAINWNIIQPGDTIYISGGLISQDYTSSSYLLPKKNGTYNNYIYIVKGQDAGHNGTVIIDRIGAMNGSSSPGHQSDSSLVNNHCIEFNGFQITKYIAHQDEVQTNNFVPNGYHLRFKNITCDNVTTDKFFDFTGHPRYIEFINCYLRQSPTGGEQEDLIWVRGDADYPGGGLYADSIFIIGCTLISNNQSSSPHSDGFQYVSVANVWTEGCKFYTANNKTQYTQSWYGNGYSGNAWFLNNVFYLSTPTTSAQIYLNPTYIVEGNVDSVYWVDNTVVANLTAPSDRCPFIYNGTGSETFNYVIKNNIAVGSGVAQAVGHYEDPGTFTTSFNQWYNPGQSTVVYYNGSYRSFSYMQGLDPNAINSQPTFINFDWNYSKILSTYEAYDFNVPSPLTGTPFTTSFGGHKYTSDGKIGASISGITLPTDISDNLNSTVIKDFYLYQNYPNPFNPSTKISWQSPVSGHQTLKVYDLLGNEVATLVDEYRDAGKYEIEFNSNLSGRQLASGIYFYRLQAGSFTQIKKMILLK